MVYRRGGVCVCVCRCTGGEEGYRSKGGEGEGGCRNQEGKVQVLACSVAVAYVLLIYMAHVHDV